MFSLPLNFTIFLLNKFHWLTESPPFYHTPCTPGADIYSCTNKHRKT